jgi:glycoprotein endo-alpha-1,2-mannosidase
MRSSIATLAVGVLAAGCTASMEVTEESLATVATRRVMTFMYLWYGDENRNYSHWSHEVLPHWTDTENKRIAGALGKRFEPPHEIHAPYWPQRGLYDSSDPAVLSDQMQDLAAGGIGVAVISWWGRPSVPGTHDTQGISTDEVVPAVLDAAEAQGIKVAFHLEPYAGRTALSVAEDVQYLEEQYGDHPAVMLTTHAALVPEEAAEPLETLFVPRSKGGKMLLYVYDSYHISAKDWAAVMSHGSPSLSQSAVFLGLVLDYKNVRELADAGFHGAYTYFGTIGFSFGSTLTNWARMQEELATHGMAFVPSVSPGYDDRRIRPWNIRSMRLRASGGYYKSMWQAALLAAGRAGPPNCQAVSITSYNEWGEGTQIEPAVPHTVESGKGIDDTMRRALGEAGLKQSQDYGRDGPNVYLGLSGMFGHQLVEAVNEKAAKDAERLAKSQEL